ncbi:MAG: DMT family transporter, partial [Propionicimonas sp.]
MNTAAEAGPQPHEPGRLGFGVALGLAASLAFATSGPFVRPLLEIGWTPGAAVFWRVTGAAVLMLPLALWLQRGRIGRLVREWRAIAAFGALAVATPQLMFFAAVDRMSVSIALLIEYMAPVLLVGLAWARSRRPPSRLV